MKLFEPLLEFLFPRFCLFCDRPRESVCDECRRKKFKLKERYFCEKCGLTYQTNKQCGCISELDKLMSVVKYDENAARVVSGLKFGFFKEFAQTMATMMLARLAETELSYDLIVPVPLARKRKWWRGFNQAELIADKIGKIDNYLQRVKYKRPQVGLNRNERKINIKDSFSVIKSVSNKKVLLIDDVVTTGSTMLECAVVLKQAGAKRVYGFAWAGADFVKDSANVE